MLDPDPPVPTSSGSADQQAGNRDVSSSKKKSPRASSSRGERRRARRGNATGENSDDEEDYYPSDSELPDSDVQAEEDGDVEIAEDSDTSITKGTRGVAEAITRADIKVEMEEQGLPQTDPSSTTAESPHVEETGTTSVPIEIDEDEEPKPKLALELKYRTFSNFNRCLCVVVEPWPPQRSNSRAPSLVPSAVTRAPSVAPTTSEVSTTTRGQRAKTPLFLPDDDDEPTTPSHSRFRTLPPVPLFDDPPASGDIENIEEWGDNAALMQFSQMLNATGRVDGGDVQEEDEFDGMALFADADEAKEL